MPRFTLPCGAERSPLTGNAREDVPQATPGWDDWVERGDTGREMATFEMGTKFPSECGMIEVTCRFFRCCLMNPLG